jgi:chromosome segregation ATPase
MTVDPNAQDWINALLERVDALEKLVHELRHQVTELENSSYASEEHYHDHYASIEHVERSENSYDSQLYRIKDDVSNLEYKMGSVERTANEAERMARNAGGSRY